MLPLAPKFSRNQPPFLVAFDARGLPARREDTVIDDDDDDDGRFAARRPVRSFFHGVVRPGGVKAAPARPVDSAGNREPRSAGPGDRPAGQTGSLIEKRCRRFPSPSAPRVGDDLRSRHDRVSSRSTPAATWYRLGAQHRKEEGRFKPKILNEVSIIMEYNIGCYLHRRSQNFRCGCPCSCSSAEKPSFFKENVFKFLVC